MGYVRSYLETAFSSLGYLRNRDLLILGSAGLIDTMSVSLIVPFLPVYADQTGASMLLIGLMFSAETIAKSAFSTPFGYLSDVSGRKVWIFVGMLLSGLAVLALGVFSAPLVFILLRAVDGVGGAMRNPATTAYIGDRFDREERGRAMGAYYTLTTIGLAAGPMVGAGLTFVFDISTAFVALGAATVLSSVLIAVLLPTTERPTDDRTDATDGLLPSLPSRRSIGAILSLSFVVLATSGIIGQLGTGVFNPLFPVLLDEQLAVSEAYTGIVWGVFGLSMLLFTPIGGSLSDFMGRKPTMVASQFAWGLVPIALVFADSRLLPLALLFLGGIASAVMNPALRPLLYEVAPADYEGTTIGAYNTLTSAAFALGPILGGYASGVVGIRPTFVAIGVLWFVSGAVLAVGIPSREGNRLPFGLASSDK